MFDINEAVGRWVGIFQTLGIEVGDGRHCPCPVCGGEDRFRFDDKEGRGTWFCNACGAGDGWKLIQLKLGVNFKQAIEEISSIIGRVSTNTIIKEKSVSPEMLRKIFKNSKPASREDFVGAYLYSRGINNIPPTIRAGKCYESETKKEAHAMLAVVTSPAGKALTMHRTFLTIYGDKAPIKKPKKLLPGLDKLTGSAIRLFEHDGEIGLAEGIETALSCAENFNIPTWASISSTLMESFIPPKKIKKIIIFGDNDENFTGQKAAYSLANRLTLQNKIETEVKIPKTKGCDWLDEIKMGRQDNNF